MHDFGDTDRGKVIPYGVYDITANAGCVSLGIDNDTAQFSVNSIRRWLDVMGRERYPATDALMITADGGGSNGSRVKLFKLELQKLADETGLTLQVCHYQRRRDGKHQYQGRCVPSRMELHHLAQSPALKR